MTKLLLAIHVIAAIVTVGPVTVAASMFPAAVRRARAEPGDRQAVAVVRVLHRICRVYALLGLAVPVFGLATAGVMKVTGNAWVIVSIALTALAAGVLGLLVLPRQSTALAELAEEGEERDTSTGSVATARRVSAQLAMYTGVFNLLWASVTVLMILRPGSTTGA